MKFNGALRPAAAKFAGVSYRPRGAMPNRCGGRGGKGSPPGVAVRDGRRPRRADSLVTGSAVAAGSTSAGPVGSVISGSAGSSGSGSASGAVTASPVDSSHSAAAWSWSTTVRAGCPPRERSSSTRTCSPLDQSGVRVSGAAGGRTSGSSSPAAFASALGGVARRANPLQVRVRVVVTGIDVVDLGRGREQAHLADRIAAQDAGTPARPIPRQARGSVAARPGGHDSPPRLRWTGRAWRW